LIWRDGNDRVLMKMFSKKSIVLREEGAGNGETRETVRSCPIGVEYCDGRGFV